MKKYIESIEQGEGENLGFIKEEVEANTEEEVFEKGIKKIKRTYSKAKETSALNKVKAKEKSGKTYKRRIHICNHEEGQPCIVEDLE
ncbi:MAG: hypothetical protein ACTSWD_04980 [Candidatus Heimdallarchaeota archaeon]